jgi:flagellar P-ring protein precursor FlgI
MTIRARTRRAAALTLLALAALAPAARAAARIGDLVIHPGDVPRRLVGYGLVVGLDGTGDRSFGVSSAQTPTVRSVVNLLRRFSIEVPGDRLRLRNVAAVLVTAEVSPYLRAGGRFEVHVAALGDATSLRGGVLWMTPLLADPNQPPVATAQGSLYASPDEEGASVAGRRANTARIAQGGLLEIDPPAIASASRLLLREPDLGTAAVIARAINATFGDSTATVDDPGSVSLKPPASTTETLSGFLAAVDTLSIDPRGPARIIVDGRDGTVVAGGDIRVGAAVVSHHGITLQIGGTRGAAVEGLVRVEPSASVEDVAAGLHAARARPEEIAAIFDALRAAGALTAQVTVR